MSLIFEKTRFIRSWRIIVFFNFLFDCLFVCSPPFATVARNDEAN